MTDTAATVKKTIEQATTTAKVQGEQFKAQSEKVQAASAQAFKDGLEKSTAAFGELGAQSKQNLDAVVASATAAQKGAEALSAQALSYGKTSWETGVAAAQTIVILDGRGKEARNPAMLLAAGVVVLERDRSVRTHIRIVNLRLTRA